MALHHVQFDVDGAVSRHIRICLQSGNQWPGDIVSIPTDPAGRIHFHPRGLCLFQISVIPVRNEMRG